MAKGPGKSFRKGMSLIEAVQFFNDEEATEQFFIQTRWPNGIACPFCGSLGVNERPNRRPQPFRCGDCFGDFSVKTNTLQDIPGNDVAEFEGQPVTNNTLCSASEDWMIHLAPVGTA